MLRRVIVALEAFRPVANLYFASTAVPLAKRMETYATVCRLWHIEGLLARESVPLSFDIRALLGPLAPGPVSQQTGASALAIALLNKVKVKFDSTKDLRQLSAAVYDTVEATDKKMRSEMSVDREIRGIRDLKAAELVVTIGEATMHTYFSVEINGRYRLLFFPPGYAKVARSRPAVVIHHPFDPRLLEDGPNRFRLAIHTVADFPFAKGAGEVDMVELKAQ